uniref:SFRICE_000273 n=1 Tax=Spodoptera frugiperda TaxID=7108 RepID=A0A2H1W177_SPOFR
MTSLKYKVESGVQLLARLTKKPPGLKQDDVVELVGEEISSSLLIDLIVEALLPSKINVEPIGSVKLVDENYKSHRNS